MIVEFKYTNKKNETKERRVFVVRDTNTCLEGLDLSLLTRKECNEIKKKFGTLKPSNSDDRSGNKIDGWNSEWNRAWRRFNKSGIC